MRDDLERLLEVFQAPVRSELHPRGAFAWVAERKAHRERVREAIASVLADQGLSLDELTWGRYDGLDTITLRLKVSGDPGPGRPTL